MLYRLFHILAWPFARWRLRFAARGTRHVPATGGVILAANHASFADPILIGCAVTSRPIFFMAKEELFRVPVFGFVIRLVNALPIRRGGVNRRALEEFAGLTRDGSRALLVFPEGTRTTDGSLGPAKRGVGALCRAARVPIIPTLILGTYELWPRWRLFPRWRGRIEVRFGAPVQWSDDELNASGDPSGALATLIMKRISQLHARYDPPVGFGAGSGAFLRRPTAVAGGPGDEARDGRSTYVESR